MSSPSAPAHQCPNCQAPVEPLATECERCHADFGPDSSWKPALAVASLEGPGASRRAAFEAPLSPVPANVRVWASLAIVFWLLSMWSPFERTGTGLLMLVITLTFGWGLVLLGPWAALANFTLPWAAAQLFRGRRALRPGVATLVLAFTAPGLLPWLLVSKSPSLAMWILSVACIGVSLFYSEQHRKARALRNELPENTEPAGNA